jgi:ElaB/YqjD/DUF883 family membrane-anchored ribosome-binding protein
MNKPDASLAVAAQRSAQARQRLAGTLVEIQARLNPKALAREAAQDLREAGEELAREGLESIKRHPLPVVGVLAAIGLFFARRPVRALLAKLPDETPARETPATPPRLPPKPRTRGKSR